MLREQVLEKLVQEQMRDEQLLDEQILLDWISELLLEIPEKAWVH